MRSARRSVLPRSTDIVGSACGPDGYFIPAFHLLERNVAAQA